MNRRIQKSFAAAVAGVLMTLSMTFNSFAWGKGVMKLEFGDLSSDSLVETAVDQRGGFRYAYLAPGERQVIIRSSASTAPPAGKKFISVVLEYSETEDRYVPTLISEPSDFEYDKEYTILDGYDEVWNSLSDTPDSENTVINVAIVDSDTGLSLNSYFRISKDSKLINRVAEGVENHYGWKKDSAGWRYLYSDDESAYSKNEWQYINRQWYFFGEDGYMKTGWQQINGDWYNFDESGAMISGAEPTGQP